MVSKILLKGRLATKNEKKKRYAFNPLSAKLTKWPNTLKKFVGNLATNCLSVFGRFVGLALKGLSIKKIANKINRTAKSFFILEINPPQVFMTSMTSKVPTHNILPCTKEAYELFWFFLAF